MPKLILDYAAPEHAPAPQPSDWRVVAVGWFAAASFAAALVTAIILTDTGAANVSLERTQALGYCAGAGIFGIMLAIIGDRRLYPPAGVCFLRPFLLGLAVGAVPLGVSWIIAQQRHPTGSCIATRCWLATQLFLPLMLVLSGASGWLVGRASRRSQAVAPQTIVAAPAGGR
jgi:hypothetical protein